MELYQCNYCTYYLLLVAPSSGLVVLCNRRECSSYLIDWLNFIPVLFSIGLAALTKAAVHPNPVPHIWRAGSLFIRTNVAAVLIFGAKKTHAITSMSWIDARKKASLLHCIYLDFYCSSKTDLITHLQVQTTDDAPAYFANAVVHVVNSRALSNPLLRMEDPAVCKAALSSPSHPLPSSTRSREYW